MKNTHFSIGNASSFRSGFSIVMFVFGDVGGETSKIFGMFTPKMGELIQFDERIFQMGWLNHQQVMFHGNGSSKISSPGCQWKTLIRDGEFFHPGSWNHVGNPNWKVLVYLGGS